MTEGESTVVAGLEATFGLHLEAEQKHRMRVYLETLERWNRRLNLTGMERVEEQLRYNFFESFWATREFLASRRRVADVGSGAGFPGLAMAIYRPSLEMTLIEPNHKKAVFLKEVSRRLGLAVEVFAGRGEDYPGWEAREVASFRALKPSRQLLGQLEQAGVRLLLFESRAGMEVSPAARERRRQVPGSRARFVSLAGWGGEVTGSQGDKVAG